MLRALVMIAFVVALAGCGAGGDDQAVDAPTDEPAEYQYDPETDVTPESQEYIDRLVARLGESPDYKVRREVVEDLPSGQLAFAVVARIWEDMASSGRQPAPDQFNAGQRAVFGMILADFEILNGGFWQYWYNTSASLAEELPAAARRVGAAPYADVFADAAALWPSGIPTSEERRRDEADALDEDALAALDDRYAAFQYERETMLGVVLGRYIRANLDEFTR